MYIIYIEEATTFAVNCSVLIKIFMFILDNNFLSFIIDIFNSL